MSTSPRDPAALHEALRAWLPDGDRLTGVTRLSTGHSNDTYVLDGLDRILRLPPTGEGLLPRYDLASEHAVLAALGATAAGPPVPAVHELCLDRTVAGDPFFVMDRAPGVAFEHPDVPAWLVALAPDQRDAMCTQWLGAVAAAHRLPASAVPLEPLGPAADAASWLAAARKVGAPEALIALLGDLVDNPAPVSGPPAPLHGDPHVANCLWIGHRLTVLIDWELAMVGDPLSDLGWMAAYFAEEPGLPPTAGFDLPGWWTRSQLLDAWETATGRPSTGVRRHEVLAMAKIATIFSSGRHLIETGRSADPRYEVWAQWLEPYIALTTFRASLPDRLHQ